jgi:hypothetical protein
VLTPAILSFIKILKEGEGDSKAMRRHLTGKVDERIRE